MSADYTNEVCKWIPLLALFIFPAVIPLCLCFMCDLFPESLRNALLESDSASKTERSKSYDEGLDNYREDGGR